MSGGHRVLILGAGYCGLAAAMHLREKGASYVIVERSSTVGGLSQTLELDKSEFELGPHIYFDKDPKVTALWQSVIGNDLLPHRRRTRLFYSNRFIKSPLDPFDLLLKIGPVNIARLLFSFGAAKFRKVKIDNAEDWVVSNFGRALFDQFFRVYNEKIWGLRCRDISADWAGQRIKSSLYSMIVKSLTRDPTFIVKTFNFPRLGSKSIYKAMESAVLDDDHGELRLNCEPVLIKQIGDHFEVEFSGSSEKECFSHVISTIHLSDLNEIMASEMVSEKIDAELDKLVYRNLVLVNLRFAPGSFKNMREHWVDVHDPNVKALRVTNFGNYKKELPSGERNEIVPVGVEYNCFESDDVWGMSDDSILELALADLKRMNLTSGAPLSYGVFRVEKAYPVYFKNYAPVVDKIRSHFSKFDGLVLAGRNSLYKWNNMHHSVKTGILAAEVTLGAEHDLTLVKGSVTFGKDSD